MTEDKVNSKFKGNITKITKQHFLYILEVSGFVSMNYDVIKNSQINFLFDYSSFLIKDKKCDDKIINWQVENNILLKRIGLDTDFLKEVILT